uniref:Macro domain-containing protein n=1 Tax=Vannella robusta TaxID=1487602 RepID=A0A7S4HZ35_9EUKA|mmetsp:Transcript_17891/g.22729  ORF Transcript_17891/g.22729 Transcript_17891/m.22729 type:complete len:215 (+) Transcript_17891:50-694(+)|eukprot:CAMPEP_0206186216 /NCGR_PEP_ID=MMETSP0166-20121206/2281_1 /ASSEMBLY_ACC=CAM_ASM_000260 /TAXON_ID=95228 /ORGANISM="Vannella robusta, Strain DIVA3 518/3/11/1/6" /LENGTH=214 /DNA_ID=CAMNT_0053601579 /DNA_START=36 /DNA_END=680 /DNA_ORIENTATION=+
MSGFRLVLVDINETLCKELEEKFQQFPDVEVVNDRFENLSEFDCMVSAANSFGLMDGGVDAAITKFFGAQLQERVQQYIIDHYEGEQPVGTSFIIKTNRRKHPYLAHTPTMRVPMPILRTDYCYSAMRAMLIAVKKHNEAAKESDQIKSVACTGLGTFYGSMQYDEAARQMALAYETFIEGPPKNIDWVYARTRQMKIVYGGTSPATDQVPTKY